ncbi:MAG: hypothetical protein WCY62_01275 [Clostridia bacterium]|jgi:hypothetical protein
MMMGNLGQFSILIIIAVLGAMMVTIIGLLIYLVIKSGKNDYYAASQIMGSLGTAANVSIKTDDDEVIAAITAAIEAYMQQNNVNVPYLINVKPFVRNESSNAWNNAARQEISNSKL